MSQRIVALTLTPVGNGSDYELSQTSGIDVLDPKFGKNGMKVAKAHSYVLRFRLDSPDLWFDGGDEDIFLVTEGTKCPERGENAENRNFKKNRISINHSAKILEVRNGNIDEGPFSYRICIRDKDRNSRDFDPVIINGGGGQFVQWKLIFVPLLAVAALAGIAFYLDLFPTGR